MRLEFGSPHTTSPESFPPFLCSQPSFSDSDSTLKGRIWTPSVGDHCVSFKMMNKMNQERKWQFSKKISWSWKHLHMLSPSSIRNNCPSNGTLKYVLVFCSVQALSWMCTRCKSCRDVPPSCTLEQGCRYEVGNGPDATRNRRGNIANGRVTLVKS